MVGTCVINRRVIYPGSVLPNTEHCQVNIFGSKKCSSSARFVILVHVLAYKPVSWYPFDTIGGVIEACPPSDSVTTLTVDLLIEPSGTMSLLTCGDQIHADNQFSCWGLSFPQSSIEPPVLNATCQRIANACKSNGIVGYLKIDFVTFIDPKTVSSIFFLLWLKPQNENQPVLTS